MYRERFGTDWEALESEAAIERLFALGAASAFGAAPEGEYERLCGVSDTPSDRRLMELAYEEGRARALGRREDGAGASRTPDETWAAVVSEEVVLPPSPERAKSDDGTVPYGVPEQVGRSSLLDLSRDRLERIRLPEFLRRED